MFGLHKTVIIESTFFRAVYRNADTYLLDDPLSAVDSRVGKRLFNECINGLLRDKTRILVTHHLQYLKEADEIILIDNVRIIISWKRKSDVSLWCVFPCAQGRVEYRGDFANLQKNDELFQHLNLQETKTSDKSTPKSSCKSLNIADEDEQVEPVETEKLLKEESGHQKKDKFVPEKNKKKLTPIMMYWKYFTSGGSSILPYATLIAFAGAQLLYSGCDFFVAYWYELN